MNVRELKTVHFVGIGGINMSAVAKLLLAAGIRVSGSDVAESEQTKILGQRGATIMIGHAAENVPSDAQALVYTSAVPATNPERVEGKKRGLPEFTNFQFLGAWTEKKIVILVTGTHGKSTTTAMLGKIFERADVDPTVVVGSKVPGFPDGNIRLGKSEFFIIEGDEYAKHFLEFRPMGIIITNIELDHTDVFPTLNDMKQAFKELIETVQKDGIIVANIGDVGVQEVIHEVRERIGQKDADLEAFSDGKFGRWIVSRQDANKNGKLEHVLMRNTAVTHINGMPDFLLFPLHLPGRHNMLNASAAAIMAIEWGVDRQYIGEAFDSFSGIWRRFEFLCEKNGANIYSDYGHHPTAVAATLAAAKEQFPSSRVVLCFQPHHRNRTKHLFLDFIPSFDLADVLVLCEIYDVAGRDASEDENVSSKDLVDAVVRHDADRGVKRVVEYAADPTSAVKRTSSLMQSGDIVIIMGAGDIDAAARILCNI